MHKITADNEKHNLCPPASSTAEYGFRYVKHLICHMLYVFRFVNVDAEMQLNDFFFD